VVKEHIEIGGSDAISDHLLRASEDRDAHPAHPAHPAQDRSAVLLAADVVILDVGGRLLLNKVGIVDLA
jgi:hypothetical protein